MGLQVQVEVTTRSGRVIWGEVIPATETELASLKELLQEMKELKHLTLYREGNVEVIHPDDISSVIIHKHTVEKA